MKKILLLILDGFGIREEENGNAIKMSNLPNLNKIMNTYSVAHLNASGSFVGLPDEFNGNCEVGHQTIGMGRIIEQPAKIINNYIKDKSFFENDILLNLVDYITSNNGSLHIIGLVSDSGVHSCLDHIYASVALAKIKKVERVFFHFITDGKDTNPYLAKTLINEFMKKIEKFNNAYIGTVCGRYYAMDRDGNYDRVKKAYDAIIYNMGNTFSDINRCLDLHKKNDISDEYVNPSIITKGSQIREGDGVLFVNFTPNDELTDAISNPNFNIFNIKKFNNIRFASLYQINENVEPAFTKEPYLNSFGHYLSSLEYKQARIAETVKFPYVTYYFDGCEDFEDKNLYKIEVSSQRALRYDTKPEMSAFDITKAISSAMSEDIDFIVANFANPDIVSRTGNIPATTKALEICDLCLEKILEKAEENFYDVIITSDHGNVEYMKDNDGNIVIGSSSNNVPFVIVNSEYKLKNNGNLSDIVPTIIDMYGISKPQYMTGESLLKK